MFRNSENLRRLLFALAGILMLLILIRVPFMFRVLLVIVAPLGLLGWLAVRLLEMRRAEKEKTEYANSVEGSLERRITYCKAEVAKNKNEVREIEENIVPLQQKLQSGKGLSPSTVQETQKLIDAFEGEKKLRLSKIRFFEQAMEKLQSMLNQHQLSKMLAEKQEKLRELQEHNFEAIADLEAFRSDIEYDRAYLETIDDLSNRLLDSQSLSHVETIQKELELMTASLDQKKSS